MGALIGFVLCVHLQNSDILEDIMVLFSFIFIFGFAVLVFPEERFYKAVVTLFKIFFR